MPIKISSSRKKRNNPIVVGIVFIFLGIFLTFQLKSAKLLFISLIGVLALIFWWKRRAKLGPVTASQRIADVVTSIKRVNIIVVVMFLLFSIGTVSALEITLNSPIDNAEYESNSVNLNVNFNELAKCNYTLNAPLPPDSSGSSHGMFNIIPSYGDNPENYQASPVVGYTDNYNYNLDLSKGYDYTFKLSCINQEGTQASKEISFSVKDECTENWECDDWSDCSGSGQYRTCIDTNNCEDRIREIAKPTTFQTCTPETCTENWQCGSWSDCNNNQETRTCTDGNSCGTTINKPQIQSDCVTQVGDGCTKYFECPNGNKVKKCELVESGRCVCKAIHVPEDCIEENDNNNQNEDNKIAEKINDDKPKTISASNNKSVEVKIIPETASQIAIDRLGELEFEIELKEVGKGNASRLVYEAKAKKQGRFLGLFKIKGEVSIQIDAETGEIISTKKPWWSFLVSGI